MRDKIKHYQKRIIKVVQQLRDVRVIGLLFFLVILLLITWSGVKAIDTNYTLQKQISQLEQQNEVQKLANTNLKLQNDYYSTPQYLELSAREDFGMAAPGETVLIIPSAVALKHTIDLPGAAPVVASKTPAKQLPGYQRNFNAWMDFFFHRPSED